MTKRILAAIMTVLLLLGLCACGEPAELPEPEKPTVTQIQNICQLSTLQCYYHNVAKSNKAKADGLKGLVQKDRKFWVEYTGIVTLGVDMKKASMTLDGSVVTVILPKAEIMNISIDPNSYSADSIIMSQGGIIFENKILAEDVTLAVNDSLESMRETAAADVAMLTLARNRAKKLIGNYIDQISEISGVQYTVIWQYPDGTADN